MIEAIGLLSIAMIGGGCYFIYAPLGLLIPGIILLTLSCLATYKQPQKQSEKKEA